LELLKTDAAEARCRALTETYPKDPDAWRFLASSMRGPSRLQERIAALETAFSFDSKDPITQTSLAWEYLEARQPTRSLELAESAAKAAPWNGPILDTYARALAENGN